MRAGLQMMQLRDVLAETFRNAPTPENLTAWVDANPPSGSDPMPGQLELPFCVEVNSEFTSDARPGADWGTWK